MRASNLSISKFLLLFVVLIFVLVGTGRHVHAAVWDATAQWNDTTEAEYRDWVAKRWNKDFFSQDGPMKGSILDCADVVYSVRVMFAVEHGLPFAMKDPTSRGGRSIISNEMTRWDSKPPEQRVRAFVQLVYAVASTASLPADTYPTAIGPTTLGAGSVILTDPEKHHSWTIQRFSQTGIPYLLFGSRPARTLLYERNDYPSVGFVFPQGIRPETNAGFRNFRNPADIGKPVEQVPGFSLEQYSFSPANFMRVVQKRMQQIQETNEQRVLRVLGEACRGAKERVDAVAIGVTKNAAIGERCMDATEFDDNSTPSRDARLKDSFMDLAGSYRDAMNTNSLSLATRKQIEFVLHGGIAAPNSNGTNAICTITIGRGQKLNLGQVYALSMGDRLSNNPHDSLEQRWGLQAGPSAKAQSCPVY